MGLTSSMIDRPVDPMHIFTGQDHVRHMLLEELYMWSGNHLETLRSLFDASSTRDREGEPSYWTVDTFVGYLVERNADATAVIKSAGSLLYKMFIHYGSFPFPVDKEKRMTCGTFLRGIYMISRTKNRVLSRVSGTLGGEPVTRERRQEDDVRILFQSIAMDSSRSLENTGQRLEEDDEDLIDVLYRLIEAICERRTPKFRFRRRDVLPAAALLPSSRSRDLQGSIPVRDLKLLLELVITLLNARSLAATLPSDTTIIERMVEGFKQNSEELTCVDWQTFRDIVLGSFPSLLSIISGFIEMTFEVTTFFWLELPLPLIELGTHRVVSRSEIIVAEQFPQLLLIIPGGLAMHFQSILLQLKPSNSSFQDNLQHASNIAKFLQAPGHLLIAQTMRSALEVSKQPRIFCVYTGAPRELPRLTFDSRDRFLGDKYLFFGITPVHAVYQAGTNDVGDILETWKEEDGFVINAGALSLAFTDALRRLQINVSSTAFEGEVVALEVWKMES